MDFVVNKYVFPNSVANSDEIVIDTTCVHVLTFHSKYLGGAWNIKKTQNWQLSVRGGGWVGFALTAIGS